jgi:orotidine-5'-phosphate decarboxylase
MERHFGDLLSARATEGKFVSVGLDSDLGKIPKAAYQYDLGGGVYTSGTIAAFNTAIVEATHDLVGAYKPNLAFYLAHGEEGLAALRQTIQHIHDIAPEVPVILDAKVGDIGNTNAGYAKFAFDHLQADAITVHPWLGAEAMKPFLDRANKGVFVLCHTSNPGAGELQDLWSDGRQLYQEVAINVAELWNGNGNCGLVVGATYPSELVSVRRSVADLPILIPGIGAQGGELKESVLNGLNSQWQGIIINSSRGIIFASDNVDFAEAARRETLTLHNGIQDILRASKG